MAQGEEVFVTLDDFEQRVVVKGLYDLRNALIREGQPTEDVNDVLLKVIDAPPLRKKRRGSREAR